MFYCSFQVFYICDHGWPKITFCPEDTIWTPALERCEDKYDAVNADCRYVAPPRPIDLEILPETIDPGETLEFKIESF